MTEEQRKQAWMISLRLLAATPKSRKELTRKLTEKGFDPGIVEETLDGLEQKGLLSDRAYAQNLISRFVNEKPSGKRKISFELKRRGVPGKIQQELLDGISVEQETENARDLARLKWERFKSLEPEKRKKRVYDFLLRRGFDFNLVRDVMQEITADADTE